MTARLYLVRHADAGDRGAWDGDDGLRPLNQRGVQQAMAICGYLESRGVDRLVSSPSLRCLETFQPLVVKAGLPLDSDPRVAEGSLRDKAWASFEELLAEQQTVAVCSHGDVIPDFLLRLQAHGTRFEHVPTWPKASIWVVTGDGDKWADAEYVPPPEA